MRWTDGYIAVDWGTTNRRAYRIERGDRRADELEDRKGVLSVPPGGFSEALAEIRRRLGDLPLLLAGMIGSNRGWHEAPYVPCPASFDELVKGLVRPGEREVIVPGVSYLGEGRADVMRGEEVQFLGAVAAGLTGPDARLCQPGTHNKWATLRHGRIVEFRTVMTGELFNLLKAHSVLSDLLEGRVEPNDAFREAARHALATGEPTADLFSVRARVLLGKTERSNAASWISGLLIGSDVRIGVGPRTAERVVVMGGGALTRLYAAAVEEAGGQPVELDGEQCFLAGIREIARRIAA